MNDTQLVSPHSSLGADHSSHDQSGGQPVDKARGWKLRHWIALGYSVPVIALVVSAALTVANVHELSQISADLQTAWELGDKVDDDVRLNVQVMTSATRGYLLLRNPRSLEAFIQARETYTAAIDELDRLVVNEEQRESIATADALISEFIEEQQRLINLVNQDQSEEAIQAWRDSHSRDVNAQIAGLLSAANDIDRELVNTYMALEEKALRRLQITLLTAAAISVILSILIGALVVRKASQIMGQAAGDIVSSASEIAASVEQQERTSSQQAASVSETSTTMDELGASSRQSAEQAAAAAAGAQQALELTEGGTQAVERSLEGMTDLREKVDAIADQILRLSEQTSQIGNISGLVSDLANQTNMLALNAAVEAARAGEHGRGFAVVSGEIRKLADQSKRSAEKINALVADIQTAINSTVMVTDEGTKTVEEGVKIAEETADAFAGVADAINNVVLNSQQISLNVKQQAVAIQQVVSAMNSLDTGAQENAHGIGQIKTGTHQLNESALQLKMAI